LLRDHQSENNMNHLHCHTFFRDEDYLRKIEAGGQEAEAAITCLYKKHRSRAFTAMNRLILKHPDFRGSPEDLVHDAFLVMIHKLQFESVEVRSLSGFWVGIGKNIFLNELKKDERLILVKENEEKYGLNEETPENLFLKQEARDQMAKTFARLGPRCREILLLWVNQYTMTEITQELNLTNVAMARKTKYECFKKLKELVRIGNKMPG
jgi:RNA polymerase sigma factor (sigma-70 family)